MTLLRHMRDNPHHIGWLVACAALLLIVGMS
jgi:hypothetical protein